MLLIQIIPCNIQSFAESLEMNDFPFTEEFDHVVDIGIIGKPKDIIIGHPGFLLRSQILGQIHAPGGISTVVVCQLFTVYVNVSRGVRTADLKIVKISCGKLAFVLQFLGGGQITQGSFYLYRLGKPRLLYLKA